MFFLKNRIFHQKNPPEASLTREKKSFSIKITAGGQPHMLKRSFSPKITTGGQPHKPKGISPSCEVIPSMCNGTAFSWLLPLRIRDNPNDP